MVYDWQSHWKKASAAQKGSLASFFSSPNKHKDRQVETYSPKRTKIDLPGAPRNHTNPNRGEAGSGVARPPPPSPAPGGTVKIGTGMFAKHTGVKRPRSTVFTSPMKGVQDLRWESERRWGRVQR